MMQPPVQTNRFFINLKSVSTGSSSQGSSDRQHWSSFSAPDFRIPDLSLGNIGEDLQHGYDSKPANDDHGGDQEMDAPSLNIQGSPETELEEMSTTSGTSSPRSMVAQVSIRIHSGSEPLNKTPLRFRPVP